MSEGFLLYWGANKAADGGAGMRGFMRLVTSVLLAMMSTATISVATIAAPPAGSITGFVYEEDGTTPIAAARVSVYDWDTGVTVAEGYTNVSGSYTITGLPSGSYRVKATATGHLPEYYHDTPIYASATEVSVTDPNQTSGIGFTLTPGSTISGFVYAEDGSTPITGARVIAYKQVGSTWEYVAHARTDPDGSYTMTTGTGGGTYFIKGMAKGYAAEYYANVTDPAAATAVSVAAGGETPGINFNLTRIGFVSGTVYQHDGVTPVSTAHIVAYNSATSEWVDEGYSGATAGYYYINLPLGTYRLKAEAPGYVTEWYANVTTFNEATPVSVTDLNEKPNFNFTLDPLLGATTNPASSITTTSARLNGYLAYLHTASPANVSFVWGKASGGPYPEETSSQSRSTTGAFYASLSGLTSGTTYYYKVKAVADADPVYGEERSLTTVDVTAPVISSIKSDNITVSGATITWATNEPATTQVQYGLTSAYLSTSTLDTTPVTSHSVNLTGLNADTTYHFRVLSKDASNNQAESEDYTFTTATRRSGGMPSWAWIVIGIAAVAVVGGVAYLIVRSATTGRQGR